MTDDRVTGRVCEGTLPRRAFLRLGLTGVSGLTLADLLRTRALGDSLIGSPAPSIILIWLWGGPSHLETFDLKPDAPVEYRGLHRPIPTNVPGIFISEKLPRLAGIADKFSLIRSCAHDSPGHVNSTHTMLTGYTGELVETPPFAPKQPFFHCVADKLLPLGDPRMPRSVALPSLRYVGGGHLGPSYNPFPVSGDPGDSGFKPPNFSIDERRRSRLAVRSRLLAAFDTIRTDIDRTGTFDALDSYERQALAMLTGDKARDAFDISREDPRLHDRYGRNVIGRRCLLARRLVEAGVRLVTVDFPCLPGQKAFSWDDHASVWNIFEQMEIRLPVLDAAVSALIEDVHCRGLDKHTLIIVMGEMGRTPRLSNHNGTPGREHWSAAMSILMSGGGMNMGTIVGETTARGEEPKTRRLRPADVLATWYKYLGIDPSTTFADRSGRPIPILPDGEAVRELL